MLQVKGHKGPIAKHIGSFSNFLAREGYASRTIESKCVAAAKLSAWMNHRGVMLKELDEGLIKQFHTRPCGGRSGDRLAIAQLLQLLRQAGHTPSLQPKVERSPLTKLMSDYEDFLRNERGLARITVEDYLPVAQRFLSEHISNITTRRDHLTPTHLDKFILREAQRVSYMRAKCVIKILRSLLRFLHKSGRISHDLAAAVPTVPSWRLSHIPKTLPPDEIERLLQSCDRNTSAGQRDYAIMLLLARLGLRSGEVLAMTLDDLDWKQGEVLIRGKNQRFERLPMPRDVGGALVQYLRNVRPDCSTRHVFVHLRAPRHALGRTAICCVVHRALKRAGLSPAFKGSHLFRHSLATKMLRRGASLGQIGDLLRHSQPSTTQIYAKVDIDGLREVGLPWMGGKL